MPKRRTIKCSGCIFGLVAASMLYLNLVSDRQQGSVIHSVLDKNGKDINIMKPNTGNMESAAELTTNDFSTDIGDRGTPRTETDRIEPIQSRPRDVLQRSITPRSFSAKRNWTRVHEVPACFARAANCAELFANSSSEQERAKNATIKNSSSSSCSSSSSSAYYNLTLENCELFRKERQYIMSAGSTEEAEFPLAFSIMMYREPEMTERLLRAIYRPQNVYCLHVDAKANGAVYQFLESFAACFPNVLLAPRVTVTWGTWSGVEAGLSCMRTLWPYHWRYLIDVTGEEFPLMTNRQLVKKLKTFNGTNLIHGSVKWTNPKRWGDLSKRPAPHNITLTKGLVFFAVTRGYVDFVLHNPISLDFQNWTAKTKLPDETFFTSLQHNPQLGVPGSHSMLDEDKGHPKFLLRHKIWLSKGNPKEPSRHCYGTKAHNLCIFGVGDLPNLKDRPEMFVNKFHANFEPLAYDCMEELFYNRTREEIVAGAEFIDQHTIQNTD